MIVDDERPRGRAQVDAGPRPIPDELEIVPGEDTDADADADVDADALDLARDDDVLVRPTPESLGLRRPERDLLPARKRFWRRTRRPRDEPDERDERDDREVREVRDRRAAPERATPAAPTPGRRGVPGARRPDLNGFPLDSLPRDRRRLTSRAGRTARSASNDPPATPPAPRPAPRESESPARSSSRDRPSRDPNPAGAARPEPAHESGRAAPPEPARGPDPDPRPEPGTGSEDDRAPTRAERQRARAEARAQRREHRLARKRARRRRWMLRRICAGAVLAALGVPVLLATLVLEPQRVAAQVTTPPVQLGEPDRALYAAFRTNTTQTQPVIVSYHDIRTRPKKDRNDPYTVTPEHFDEQMSMLEQSGFTSLDSRQVLDWIDGKPVPPRSVWITFDDAPKGLWIYADQILARHHFRATVFTITGVVGTHQPYYLNWDELKGLQASGRWDVEAHTHFGHWRVPVDANGHTAPFLVNRRWLPSQHRLETIQEWDARVTGDLRASRDDIVRHGFPAPVFFAYPFSAVTFPSNDPRIPPLLEARTRELFRMSVVNAENAGLLTRRDVAKHLLPRVEVLGATTARGMFDHVAMWEPLQVAQLRPFAENARWVDEQGHPVPATAFNGDTLTLPTTAPYSSAYFAPGRLASWTDYQTSVHVAGLGAPNSGVSASLHVLSGSDGEYAVSLSAGWVRILRGRTSQQALVVDRAIRRADAHDVTITTSNGHVTVTVDGTVVYAAPEEDVQLGLPAGGVGLSVYRNRPDSPQPMFSAIRIEPITAPAGANAGG